LQEFVSFFRYGKAGNAFSEQEYFIQKLFSATYRVTYVGKDADVSARLSCNLVTYGQKLSAKKMLGNFSTSLNKNSFEKGMS